MKNVPFLPLALAALLAGGFILPAAEAAPGTTASKAAKAQAKAPAKSSKALPDSYNGKSTKAQDWADCEALEKRLSADIRSKLKGVDAPSIQAFLAEPANRLLLAQWHLAHCENAIKPEGTPPEGQPRSFRELLEAGDARTASMVQLLMNNLEWAEKAAYSGECLRPGRAVAIMDALRKDKELGMKDSFLYDKVLLDVATATGLEWARSNWDFNKAVARGRFYMKNYADKRFHKGFKKMPFWHYRVICGCKGDNDNGSVASLEWALDNVHLPVEQYTGACWYANYLSDNLFGDSIHGAYYYGPYAEVYGENAVQRSLDIGGVCGSLSHFGAFSALANGVPALTAGEPGHCAYIVCVNGKWTPAYSLSWQRGLHWQVWNGNYKYSSLHMASDLYSPAQEKKTAFSNACRSLAELYAAAGQKDKARNCFRAAVKVQPCNYLAWSNYAVFLQTAMADNAAAWKTIYKELAKELAPRYPEMAAELLLGRVHAPMHRACPSSADRMECYRAFWKAVEGMGPDRWAVENLCSSQAGSLQDAKRSAEEARLAFYSMAIGCVADNSAYAPAILAWGNGEAAKMGEKMQQKFIKATLAGLSKSKGKGMDVGARENVLNQAVLGAERMRDRSSFQAIGKLLPDKYRQNRLPQWEAFPGKLVSKGGMVYASSTCQHDWPCEHWGVIEPTGGRIHTGSDTDAWVVVELPKTATINGVVTIAPEANLWRLTNMKVQYSETGKDGEWHEAGAMPNPTGHRINRLDLREEKPRARFIRIMRPGGPEVFHLNGIFVYGTPAA